MKWWQVALIAVGVIVVLSVTGIGERINTWTMKLRNKANEQASARI